MADPRPRALSLRDTFNILKSKPSALIHVVLNGPEAALPIDPIPTPGDVIEYLKKLNNQSSVPIQDVATGVVMGGFFHNRPMTRSQFLGWGAAATATVAVATACRPNGVDSSYDGIIPTPTQIAEVGHQVDSIATTNPTASPAELVQPTKEADRVYSSAIPGLLLGQINVNGEITTRGTVKGYKTGINTLYTPDEPEVAVAFGIDQEDLKQYFAEDKDNPDTKYYRPNGGPEVVLKGGIWQEVESGKVFVPFNPAAEGYPVINSNGQIQHVTENADGTVSPLDAPKEMFQRPNAIVKEIFGFNLAPVDLATISTIAMNQNGQMEVFADTKGDNTEVKAVTLGFLNNEKAKVKSYVGNTETENTVEIISQMEIPVRFSGLDAVKVGYDASGARYFYSEGFGWSKDLTELEVNLDPAAKLDLAKKIEVPFAWKDTTVLNTLMALRISEWEAANNLPAIPGDYEPTYWVNLRDITTIGSQPSDDTSFLKEQEFNKFSFDKKPFTYTGIFEMVDPKTGTAVDIIAKVAKNSGDYKGTYINQFLGVDDVLYEEYRTSLNASGIPVLEQFLFGVTHEVVPVLPPPKDIDGVSIGWYPNTYVINPNYPESPTAAGWQERGKLLSMLELSQEEVDQHSTSIETMLKLGQIYLNGDGEQPDLTRQIDHLPPESANTIMLLYFKQFRFPVEKATP